MKLKKKIEIERDFHGAYYCRIHQFSLYSYILSPKCGPRFFPSNSCEGTKLSWVDSWKILLISPGTLYIFRNLPQQLLILPNRDFKIKE